MVAARFWCCIHLLCAFWGFGAEMHSRPNELRLNYIFKAEVSSKPRSPIRAKCRNASLFCMIFFFSFRVAHPIQVLTCT